VLPLSDGLRAYWRLADPFKERPEGASLFFRPYVMTAFNAGRFRRCLELDWIPEHPGG